MLISVEGNDGVGKTLFTSRLVRELSQRHDCQNSKEPGAVLDGALRKLILETKKTSKLTDLFLFMADRTEHVAHVVRPALEANKLVILDRFVHSTFVYQSLVGGLIPLGELYQLNKVATKGLMPELVILLDAPATICNQRIAARRKKNSEEAVRIAEAEGLVFQEKVREAFLWLAEQDPTHFLVLNATNDLDLNLTLAVEEIERRLHEAKKKKESSL